MSVLFSSERPLLFAGWTSGSGGDCGGNPHENPDPEDSGTGGIDPQAIAANNTDPDALQIPTIPTGGEYDNEWGGNNPHYMPYGGARAAPYVRIGSVAKVSAIRRVGVIRYGG